MQSEWQRCRRRRNQRSGRRRKMLKESQAQSPNAPFTGSLTLKNKLDLQEIAAALNLRGWHKGCTSTAY
jgi:hypothetical protein